MSRVVVGLNLGVMSAAAVFVDGALVAAVRQEVVDRQPRSDRFPSGALDAALDVAGQRPSAVDEVVAAGGGLRGLGLRRSLAGALRAARTSGRVVLVPAAEVAAWLLARGEAWTRAPQAAAVAAAAVRSGLAPTGVLGGPGMAAPRAGGEIAAWGPDVAEIPAYRALGNAGLPRVLRPDASPSSWCVVARGRLALSGDDPSRVLVRDGASATLLGPDGVVPATPTDVIRAWRLHPGADLLLGPWWVDHSRLATASAP